MASHAELPAHQLGADRFVTDLANILPADDAQQIKQQLSDYENKTSVEIAVLIVPSMEQYGYSTIEDFANAVFRNWGIGKKVMDNGVLFVISMAEHKTRIEVGRGLEAYLTDAQSKDFLDKEMPNWRAGKFSAGTENIINEIIQTIGTATPAQRSEYEKLKAEKEASIARDKRAEIGDILIIVACFFVFVFVVIISAIYVSKKRKEKIKKEEDLKAEWDDYKGQRAAMINLVHEIELYYDYISSLGISEEAISSTKETLGNINKYIRSTQNEGSEEYSFNGDNKLALQKRRQSFMQTLEEIKDCAYKLYCQCKQSNNQKEICLAWVTSVNNEISANVESKIKQYNSSASLLKQYPSVCSGIDFSMIETEIVKALTKEAEWRKIAESISRDAKTTKFDIDAYIGFISKIENQRREIRNYFNGSKLSDAIKLASELDTAKKELEKYTPSEIQILKNKAQLSSNHEDVKASSKKIIEKVTSKNITYTGNPITDWMMVYALINEINSGIHSAESDVEEAENERIAAKRKIEEAARRKKRDEEDEERRRSDSYSSSSYSSFGSSSGSSGYDSGSSFGGGDSGGGGASGGW